MPKIRNNMLKIKSNDEFIQTTRDVFGDSRVGDAFLILENLNSQIHVRRDILFNDIAQHYFGDKNKLRELIMSSFQDVLEYGLLVMQKSVQLAGEKK